MSGIPIKRPPRAKNPCDTMGGAPGACCQLELDHEGLHVWVSRDESRLVTWPRKPGEKRKGDSWP